MRGRMALRRLRYLLVSENVLGGRPRRRSHGAPAAQTQEEDANGLDEVLRTRATPSLPMTKQTEDATYVLRST